MCDAAELIVDIEKQFEISISDRAAEKILTVGQCHDYIVSQLAERYSLTRDAGCLSSAVFYRLRRGLMQEFSVARSAIRPAQSLDALVPKQNRQQGWRQFADAVGLRLPALERPAWIETIVVMLAVVGGIFCFVSIVQRFLPGFVAGIVGILLSIVFWQITSPLAVCIPSTCRTMRSMVITVMGENLSELRDVRGKWNRQDAWSVLVALIANHFGVRPEEVTPDANFVRDFGCS